MLCASSIESLITRIIPPDLSSKSPEAKNLFFAKK